MVEEIALRPSKIARQPPPVRISRAFSVPRSALFTAWSSADHIKLWFSPETYTVSEATVQMHVGGPFDVRLRGPYGGERLIRGSFVEVAPPDRLVIDMAVSDAEGRRLFNALTEVTFAEDAIGSRIDVVQNFALADPAMATPMVWGASEGWRTSLDKLAKALAQMKGGASRSASHATLRVERIFDAPVARVWAAITEELGHLFGFGVEGSEPGPCGKSDGAAAFGATCYDVVPNERLVCAFETRLDGARISASLATVQLEPEGARTKFMITEQVAFLDGHDDAASRERDLGLLLDALGASLKD